MYDLLSLNCNLQSDILQVRSLMENQVTVYDENK